MPVRVKVIHILLTVIFIAVVIGYMVHLKKSPLYNSDMLPYMGIALQMKGYDPKQIHDSVYAITKASVPAKNYAQLTTLNQGRVDRFNNHLLFYEYLRFFRLKPLYVLFVKSFYDLGINLVLATVLPSLIFTAALLIAFYVALLNLFRSSVIPFFVGILFLLLGFTNQLAVISTPDALSSLLVFVLFLNVFFKGKEGLSYLVLALAILARIDNLVLLPIILYYHRFQKVNMKQVAKGVIIVAVVTGFVLVVPYFFGNHLMWFKDFIFKPSDYIRLVSKSARLMRTDFNLIFILFTVLFYIHLKSEEIFKTLATGVLLAMLFRFFLFPSYEERFYFIFKLILIFLMLAQYAKVWKRTRLTNEFATSA